MKPDPPSEPSTRAAPTEIDAAIKSAYPSDLAARVLPGMARSAACGGPGDVAEWLGPMQ